MLGKEAIEQIKLFQICSFIPECKFMFAVPNGGSRNKIEAYNLKRQGLKPGVPDIMLPVAKCNYHGLFIELKYGKNKTTDNQVKYIDYLNKNGYLAVVCYGCDQAFDTIKKYLKGAL